MIQKILNNLPSHINTEAQGYEGEKIMACYEFGISHNQNELRIGYTCEDAIPSILYLEEGITSDEELNKAIDRLIAWYQNDSNNNTSRKDSADKTGGK